MKKQIGAFLLAVSLLTGLALPAFAEERETGPVFDHNEGWHGIDNSTHPEEQNYLGLRPEDGVELLDSAQTWEAVYLGVEGYGKVAGKNKEQFRHRFCVNGLEYVWVIDSKGQTYPIQNRLEEGSIYDVTVQGGVVSAVEKKSGDFAGTVTAITENSLEIDGTAHSLPPLAQVWTIDARAGGASVTQKTLSDVHEGNTVRIFMNKNNDVDRIYLTPVGDNYVPPVKGTPGKKTLKNFLSIAMEPVGTTLYIYGGNWDWTADAVFPLGEEIGLSPARVEFFRRQDENYTYDVTPDYSQSYYPIRGWHQYYFAGMDCSGFVGWAAYNLENTESGKGAYVGSSTYMANRFAKRYHWGTMDYGQKGVNAEGEACRTFDRSTFYPGDIFSMNGHVWISLGQCLDGSVLILHSTPSPSRTGQPGGGVQLTGVGREENCQAHQLARYYMSTYYPEWDRRYEAVNKDWSWYTTVTGNSAGKFSWDLDSVLSDPEGYHSMRPEQVAADLFGEEPPVLLPFADVGRVDWFQPAVVRVYQDKLMAGVSGREFAPDQQMNRAQLVQILYSMAGKPQVEGELPFDDVAPEAWYADAALWAAEQDLVAGCGEGKLCPEDVLTREQLAAILYAYAGLAGKDQTPRADLTAFADGTAVADWAEESVRWAVGAGLMQGYSSTVLAPAGVVTRAEAAQMVLNFQSLENITSNNTKTEIED